MIARFHWLTFYLIQKTIRMDNEGIAEIGVASLQFQLKDY